MSIFCSRRAAPLVLALVWSLPAEAQTLLAANEPLETVIVRAQKRSADRYQLPNKTESLDAAKIADTVNVVNTEDAIKYLPSIMVRKRHIGDTQDPISTRTSGVGSSARSLIFADGVLLSSLIGNNNSSASPHWGLVAPNDIERIDVMYGPFSAAYSGNSIGAVVEMTTRMPAGFEMNASSLAAIQNFSEYGATDSYTAYQFGAGLGDRWKNLSWRLSGNHLDSHSQPITYATATRPSSTSGSGTPVTGAYATVNRTGAPIVVLGGGGLEHQKQDNISAKLAYDFLPGWRVSYGTNLFLQDDNAHVQSYLRDAGGTPVYAGSVNIDGYNYNISASSFSNGVYNLQQQYLAQNLALRSETSGVWDFEAVVTSYEYLKDVQRVPTTALPAAYTGGAGTVTRMTGTGWYTFDAKAIWRPDGMESDHLLSFGAHLDSVTLKNLKYNTTDWISGADGALANAARGKTDTSALWAQDAWKLTPELTSTLGVRVEHWRAHDGYNYSLSPALSVSQPRISATTASPKAALAWQVAPEWRATASYGVAYRFPTVGELYQAVTTGSVLSVPNPNLKPELARSFELSLERNAMDGKVRLSYFQENLSNALISQSAPLVIGSPTLYNYVQNVDKVLSRGIEAVATQNGVVFDGLELSESVTYVDSRIQRDSAFAAAVGKHAPQVPNWRFTAVATYRPDDQWAFTLAARYSDRVYATIDNSDTVTHTYQGFDGYFVMDARVNYKMNAHWNAAFGIDNLNNENYILYHPFPQRTFTFQLNYTY